MEQKNHPQALTDGARAGQGPRLSVIIVNYESWPDVKKLAASLAKEPEFASGRCEIVVVDNASRGSMPETFSLHRVGQRVVFRPDNGGFAAGVNAGWRVAQSRWLLILNPDVEVASGFLGQVFTRLDRFETDRTVRRESSGLACETPTARHKARSASSPTSRGPFESSSYPVLAGNTSPVGEFAPDLWTGSPVRACW